MTEFEKRFRSFIARCPDCEILDDGVSNPPGGIADFQINGDNVVAELKCLEADKLEPLQRLATELIETRDLPVYGQIPFYEIIKDQPDRSSLNKRAILMVAGRLHDDFKEANDQIKNTKRRPGLNNSHGLLILANTSNQPLEPELAHGFLSFLFNKRKTKDGPPICSSIDCVLYLPQIHMVGRLPDGGGLLPAIPVFRDERPEYEPLRTYLRYSFLKEWAAFNGHRYFASDQPFPETKDFSSTPLRSLDRAAQQSGRDLYPQPHFVAPRNCLECGIALQCPPVDEQMYIDRPQLNCFVLFFVCPSCHQVAEVQVADLAVDCEGNIVNLYRWAGTQADFKATNWRDFIRRQ